MTQQDPTPFDELSVQALFVALPAGWYNYFTWGANGFNRSVCPGLVCQGTRMVAGALDSEGVLVPANGLEGYLGSAVAACSPDVTRIVGTRRAVKDAN